MKRYHLRPGRGGMACCAAAAAAALLFLGAAAYAQSPSGCSVNNLNADIAFPAIFATVECGTTVPFTVMVTNGTAAGACDVSDLPVTFLCPDPATGDPTGPSTMLATADDFTAVPPSSKTYPAADCVIGDSTGPACSCGTATGVYQARVHAGPGILELNPAHIDIADVIKTVSVRCITTTTTTTTTTSTTTTSTTLPHFQCYETRKARATPVAVTLIDQFGTWSLSARRPGRLCAPVDKNGENPGAPQIPDHLVGYDLRQTQGVFSAVRNLEVTNQFGTIHVDAVRFGRLLVPAAKSLVAPPPPLAVTNVDHFLCYKVRLTPGKEKFTTVSGVNLIDQFGSKTVDLVKPRLLCNPVNKNGESPGAETHVSHLLCYDIKSSRENLHIAPVFTNDQFSPKSLELIRRDELCVPSTKIKP